MRMFSRARSVALVVALLLGLSLASHAVAGGSQPARSLTQQVKGFRHSIVWHRSRTWHFQDEAGIRRTPTLHAERRTRSLAFLHWIDVEWIHRQNAARKQARAVSSASIPAIICRVFGPSRCQTALAIANRESGFSTNPQPPNPTHFGIFQLDASALSAYARGRYRTALDQVRAAFRMFLARGWEPWTCCE